MKRIVLSLAFLSLTGLVFAQEKGIWFENGLSWEQVKAKAKSENKYIFMDVFATWCGPCKVMDREVYPSEKVGSFMNDQFISIKVQGDTTVSDNEQTKRWYPDADRIKKDFQVRGYPTFLFFSPKGKLVHQFTGGVTDSVFRKIARDALDPVKQYNTLLERYDRGLLNYAQMPDLAMMASQLKDEAVAKRVADNYINNYLLKLKGDRLFTADHMRFLSGFIQDTESKGFKFLVRNKEKVNAILGENKAEERIRYLIEKQHLPFPSTWTDTMDWNVLESAVTSRFGMIGQEAVFGHRMIYHQQFRDWGNFEKYFVLYFGKALKRPEYDINNLAWSIFEHSSDPKVLEVTIQVIKYAIETWDKQSAESYDTYANLLYKTGKRDLAIEWELKAVRIKIGAPDEKLYIDNLEKMQRGEQTWPLTSTKN